MTPIAFLRELLANGVPQDVALDLAEKFEEDREELLARAMHGLPAGPRLQLTPRQARNQRYYEKRKERAAEADASYKASYDASETSEIKTPKTLSDGFKTLSDAPLSLPPSPQTPQPPTHTRVSINTREGAREAAGFDRFWSSYPRKVSKAEARKAFARAWRKLPELLAEEIIIGGLERAKAAWTDPQFIPHAATWLNGERWNDEPATVTPIRPHERPRPADDKLSRKQANLARSLAGFDQVAGSRDGS